MSFGEGDLHGRVEQLERENARLRALLAKELYHLRENAVFDHVPQWSWVYKVEAEADQLGVKYAKEHVGTPPVRVDEHKRLESLVRDMHDALDAAQRQLHDEFDATGIDYDDVSDPVMRDFRERMRKLGIDTGGDA